MYIYNMQKKAKKKTISKILNCYHLFIIDRSSSSSTQRWPLLYDPRRLFLPERPHRARKLPLLRLQRPLSGRRGRIRMENRNPNRPRSRELLLLTLLSPLQEPQKASPSSPLLHRRRRLLDRIRSGPAEQEEGGRSRAAERGLALDEAGDAADGSDGARDAGSGRIDGVGVRWEGRGGGGW